MTIVIWAGLTLCAIIALIVLLFFFGAFVLNLALKRGIITGDDADQR